MVYWSKIASQNTPLYHGCRHLFCALQNRGFRSVIWAKITWQRICSHNSTIHIFCSLRSKDFELISWLKSIFQSDSPHNDSVHLVFSLWSESFHLVNESSITWPMKSHHECSVHIVDPLWNKFWDGYLMSKHIANDFFLGRLCSLFFSLKSKFSSWSSHEKPHSKWCFLMSIVFAYFLTSEQMFRAAHLIECHMVNDF